MELQDQPPATAGPGCKCLLGSGHYSYMGFPSWGCQDGLWKNDLSQALEAAEFRE